MISCTGCQRPLLEASASCPFCHRSMASTASRWAKRAGAVVAPFMLGACYGPPGGFVVADCWEDDLDGDGWVNSNCFVEDCDDADPEVNPGAEELCDGIDNDCDGVVDPEDCTEPDTDTDLRFGDLEVQLSFGPLASSCAEAGLQSVTLALDGPEVVPDARLPCDDSSLIASELLPGRWTGTVSGTSTDGTRTWLADGIDAQVTAGSTTVAQATLDCSDTQGGPCSDE